MYVCMHAWTWHECLAELLIFKLPVLSPQKSFSIGDAAIPNIFLGWSHLTWVKLISRIYSLGKVIGRQVWCAQILALHDTPNVSGRDPAIGWMRMRSLNCFYFSDFLNDCMFSYFWETERKGFSFLTIDLNRRKIVGFLGDTVKDEGSHMFLSGHQVSIIWEVSRPTLEASRCVAGSPAMPVLTSMKLRHLPYQELYEYKSCAKFLADFFNYDVWQNLSKQH